MLTIPDGAGADSGREQNGFCGKGGGATGWEGFIVLLAASSFFIGFFSLLPALIFKVRIIS